MIVGSGNCPKEVLLERVCLKCVKHTACLVEQHRIDIEKSDLLIVAQSGEPLSRGFDELPHVSIVLRPLPQKIKQICYLIDLQWVVCFKKWIRKLSDVSWYEPHPE